MGERRTKRSANDGPRRIKPRVSQVRTTGGEHRRKRKDKGNVVSLPQNRRSGRSPTRRPVQHSPKKAVGRWRLRLIVGLVVVVCISLGARAAQLSVENDSRYQTFVPERRVEETAEKPPGRGSVMSADGQRLAMSLEAAKVIATPYQVKDPKAVAGILSGVLGLEAGEIEAQLAKKNDEGKPAGYSIVAEGVEPQKAREVRQLGLPGVSLEPDAVRVYPMGSLASQLIGYLGKDKAYGGIEARYDEVLKGGQEVNLTLATAVQQELEDALFEAARKYEGKSALGIVMRVEDGAVLAIANAPGYDNNNFREAPEEAKRNRALTDPYEPGSTFKPFTMAAALEEGVVTEENTFIVPDFIPVADVVIHDSEPHETKVLTPRGILEHSSNVGTIQIAQPLGGERIVEHIEGFGFGERTGVDLWGEDAGRVPPYEEWSGSSIGNIPIGQGLTVTPMQLISGYATLANGGFRVSPYVAKEAAPSEPGRRVISEETSSIVRGMLQSVVDEGTGHLARIPGYTVAGETGTAQKVDPETGLYGDEYITSFIGFAPAENPEYLALIVVDEPQKDLFGEVVAAPAFQNIMSFVLSYYNVPQDREGTRDDPPPPNPTPAQDARKEDRILR
jgi:cell division protein FtsI (penicillin-binding protein 3)